jgi:hypothetical protein
MGKPGVKVALRGSKDSYSLLRAEVYTMYIELCIIYCKNGAD